MTDAHRTGVVALLGPPNSGKSTLLNRLLGEKLAIVTPKPQTTRSRILGIVNRPGAQLLLHDTPGWHESEKPLNVALNDAVTEALRDCDLALLLVDRTRGWRPAHDVLRARLAAAKASVFVVGTKADLPSGPGPWPPPAAQALSTPCVSARTGRGIEELLREVIAHLPVSPPLYPEDELTDRPLRWLAGEHVREAIFRELGQELPYSIAVDVLSFDESRPDLVAIRANVLVERRSQKQIVIGTGGEKIRSIGIRARREIERLVGRQVHLELWVVVDPKWLKNPRRIEALGYR